MDDTELFIRLYYFGTIQMGMTPETFWFMPIGLFLDLWACHRQWLGLDKVKRALSIDEIIPI
ncbi:hypothetical protein FACS1894184_03350 [Clostridia bacterium]|nr:hypothetical protein FACS1894184_03350 [Clostridia bacterium]